MCTVLAINKSEFSVFKRSINKWNEIWSFQLSNNF